MKSAVSLFVLALAFSIGCGSKQPADSPAGATPDETASGTAAVSGDAPADGVKPPVNPDKALEKALTDPDEKNKPTGANACVGFEMNLIDALSQAACEVPTKSDEKARDTKGVLEVKVIPNATKVAPGGIIEVTVAFANKTKDPLPLSFLVNPLPRFEIEVYDAKGRRVDTPPGEHPKWPSGHESAPTSEKTAQIKLAENGTGRVTLKWTASRMKWAPEKAKGAASGSPYPRAPGAPLPKGKYTLRVVTPLLGVSEGAEKAVSAPKVNIEVGK